MLAIFQDQGDLLCK